MSVDKSDSDTKTIDMPCKLKELKEIDLRESVIIPNNTNLFHKPEVYLGTKRRSYDLEDEEIKKVTLDNDIVVKLIANNKGIFVDVRKYYKGYPTKKGIRIIASKFKELSDILKDDIEKNIK